MTRRVAITSQKGGCGKTTTALNLALALAERGHRVLLVDLDPQGGIGHSLAKGDEELPGLVELLMKRIEPHEAVLQTKLPKLALLPRGRLDPVDVCELERALLEPGLLESVLQQVEPGYDLVLLDTPSGVGMPTRAALRVSDYAMVPAQAEPLALRSIVQVLRVIEHVRTTENPKLQLLGIVPTMVARSSEPSMNALLSTWRELAGVLETTIPRSEVFLRASEAGLPLAYLGGKPSPEARRFDLLAGEVLDVIARTTPMESLHAEQPARALL